MIFVYGFYILEILLNIFINCNNISVNSLRLFYIQDHVSWNWKQFHIFFSNLDAFNIFYFPSGSS